MTENNERKIQEQKAQEKLEREVEYFNAALIPFGSADIRTAVETALEAGKDGQWAAEQITEYMDSTGTKIDDIDPVYCVFDSLLQEARNDIDNLTGKDILNDTRDQVYVAGNYMCTSMDYSTSAQQELAEIMHTIDKDDYTDAMTWLWNECDLDSVTIEEEPEETEEPTTEKEA